MKPSLLSWAAAIALSSLAGITLADGNSPLAGGSNYYKEKAEGWFWYKDPVVEEKKEKKPEPEPVKAPEPEPEEEPEVAKKDEPKPMSVAWLKVNLPKYREIAIDNPTDENVRTYYYLQRVMMDKSSAFSEASTRVIMRDPFLDEDSRRPVATYAANAMNRDASAKRDTVTKQLSQQIGLFFFFNSNCVLCDEQATVLKALSFQTGISILPVSLDGGPLGNDTFPTYAVDNGQAESLKIFKGPALAMAIPPDQTEIVGYGAVTLDVLQSRILMVAKDAGLIDNKTFQSTQPVQDNGLLTAEDTQDIDQQMLDNPDEFISKMQETLAKKAAENNQ